MMLGLTKGGISAGWLLSVILAGNVFGSAPAGYQQYMVSGEEVQMWNILVDLDDTNLDSETMHSLVSVVAGGNNTTIYYDHWEDGYDFDPSDPSGTADEVYFLPGGGTKVFEGSNIPVNPRGTATYYDGRDRIFTAGGAVTVNRAVWSDDSDTTTLYGLAWEVLPTKPFLKEYVIPVGQDLYDDPPAGSSYHDFYRVYVIVQATEDDTFVSIDDPSISGIEQTVTLDEGEVTQYYYPNAGTIITSSAPVQVQFFVGQNHEENGQPSSALHYEIRGFTAVPRTLWGTEYYLPVPSFAAGTDANDSDAFFYNPDVSNTLTVTWEDSSGTGLFTIDPLDTKSYEDGAGHVIPINSGAYVSGSSEFWGIASVDKETTTYDWGYSLVAKEHLRDTYMIGWTPSTLDKTAQGSPLFVGATETPTTVFIDYSPIDGVADAQYTIDRLDVLKIFDPDFDLTGSRLWATAPIGVVWGADPDSASGGANYLDMGYTTLPLLEEWLDLALTAEKSVDPVSLLTNIGQQVTYTIAVASDDFALTTVDVVDTLPAGWAYINDSALITFPDTSTLASNPAIASQVLTWDNTVLGGLSSNETLTIVFDAVSTQGFAAGELTWNFVDAIGARVVAGSTQTFTAVSSAYNTYSDLQMTKTSSGDHNPLWPGDTNTYTIVVTNPSSSAVAFTDISVSDILPSGLTYVANSTIIELTDIEPLQTNITSVYTTNTVRDEFNEIAFANQDGTVDWVNDWQEIGESNGANGNAVRVQNRWGSDYQLRVYNSSRGCWRQVDLSGYETAVLSFDYRINGFDGAGEASYLSVSTNGGSDWVQLQEWTANVGSTTPASFDLTPYISAGTAIAFTNLAVNGGGEGPQLDNIEIQFVDIVSITNILTNVVLGVTTNTGGEPSILASGYTLGPGDFMTVTFDTVLDNPWSSGGTNLLNRAEVRTAELPAPLTDIAEDPVIVSAVGDFVWEDLNTDGLQNMGEPGVSNVTVTLYDPASNIVAVTTTDAAGGYRFDGLRPGDYTLAFAPPAGWGATLQNEGGDDTVDSDVDPVTLMSGVVTLSSGEADLSVDAGLVRLASVGDRVWLDADGDGIQDAGEAGLSGVIVYLDLDNDGTRDPGEPFDTTDAGGNYLIDELSPGTYIVRVQSDTLPADHYLTTANDPTPVTLAQSEARDDVDFGYWPATLTGLIFRDDNGDGIKQAEEPVLNGVDVQVIDSNGATQTLTTVNGIYSANIPAGAATINVVEATLPMGYSLTTANEPQGITIVPGSNSATDIGYDIVVVLLADIGITKVVNDSNPTENQSILFTLVATNSGPDVAPTVQISDVIPSGLTYLSDNGGGVYNSGSGVWDIGLMFPGDSASLVISATVDSDTEGNLITNTAIVSLVGVADTNAANDSSEAALEVQTSQPTPDCGLTYLVADAGGGNGGNDWFTKVDRDTGVETAVGTGTGTDNIEAIAFNPSGTLLYAADADELGSIDLVTGVYTTIGSFGSGDGSVGNLSFNDVDGLTFDPLTGIFYGSVRRGSADDLLIQINPVTGAHIPDAFGAGVDYVVINAIAGNGDIDDIAIDSYDGQMYAIANNGGSGDHLVKIDKLTGTATDVGELGVNDHEGLSFSNDGQLFGTTGASGDDSLYDVNKTTGAASNPRALSVGSDYEASESLLCPPNRITGTVFLDTNEDGFLDGGDIGTETVTVNLYRDANGNGVVDAGDTLVATQETDAGGEYSFDVASTGAFVLNIDTNTLPFGAAMTTDNIEVADFGTGVGLIESGNDFGHISSDSPLEIVKTSAAEGAFLDAGETNTYTIVISNTGTVTQTGIEITDTLFGALTYDPQSTVVSGYKQTSGATRDVLDLFGSVSYSNNDGSTNWSGAWTEAGDDSAAGSGRIQITGGELRFQEADNNDAVSRSADLSGSTQAVLSLDWAASGLEEYVRVQISSNGTTFVTLLTVGDSGGGSGSDDSGSLNSDISAYISGSTTVRFINDGGDWNYSNDQAFFDDVQITYSVPGVSAAVTNDNIPGGVRGDLVDGDTPGLVDSTDGFVLAAGQSMTVTFRTVVTGSLPVDLTEIPNTAGVRSDQSMTWRNDTCVDALRFVAIGDRIWFDTNGNGIQDVSETNNIANVTVNLFRKNGTFEASTTTDADGLYLFDGIKAGQYYVQFDLTGISTSVVVTLPNQGEDDTMDSNVISGNTGGFAETDIIQLSAGQTNLNVDLGFTSLRSTRAEVAEVWGEWRGEAGAVVWKTGSEWNTAGFFVYRVDPKTGAETQLNPTLIPSAFFAEGSTYETLDPQAVEGGAGTYRLEEMELTGARLDLGTHTLLFGMPRPVAMAAPMAVLLAMADEPEPEPSPVLKVLFRKEGLYGVRLQSIADGMGRPLSEIQTLAENGFLRIVSQREPVPVHFDEARGRLLFHGEPTGNWYTRDATYLISEGEGLEMPRREPNAASGETVFPVQIRFEEDRYPFDSVQTRPDDFYYWNYILSGHSSLGQRDIPLDLTGYATGDLELTVRLRGWSNTEMTPDHLAEFLFNGAVVGSITFDGQDVVDVSLTIPAATVVNGVNTLAVKGVLQTGHTHSFFVLDWIDASFERTLVPLAGTAHFRADGSVSASELAEPLVVALDEAGVPTWIADETGGISSKVWKTVTENERFAVIDAEKVPMLGTSPAAADAWFLSDSNRIDYLVIASRALAPAAQELADYRSGQGLRTGIAVFEDICDLLTGGLRTPEAIPALLRYAQEHWAEAPWMVVLAGNGHYDYLGALNNEVNHLPPLLLATHDGLFAADGLLADCDGDQLPDIALGRLPALTSADLGIMIAKIKTYESGFGSALEDQLMFAADFSDSAGNFSAANRALAVLADGGYSAEQVDLDSMPFNEARAQILSRFNNGTGFIHYTGHGGVNNLSSKNLLNSSDVSAMNNVDIPPVVVALSCLVGRYEAPGVNGLGELLMRKSGGGAVSVWGPSGLSRNVPAVELGNAFYRTVLQEGSGTLGLAILEARRSLPDDPLTKHTLAVYNLLGDPALRIAGNIGGQSSDSTFAQWRWQRFSPEELAASEFSGMQADADGNGRNNGLEYAFGNEPFEDGRATPALERGGFDQDAGEWIHIRWRQRKLHADLDYRILVSTNLVDWEPAPPSMQILSTLPVPDSVMEKITARLPFLEKNLFIKLEVIQK